MESSSSLHFSSSSYLFCTDIFSCNRSTEKGQFQHQDHTCNKIARHSLPKRHLYSAPSRYLSKPRITSCLLSFQQTTFSIYQRAAQIADNGRTGARMQNHSQFTPILRQHPSVLSLGIPPGNTIISASSSFTSSNTISATTGTPCAPFTVSTPVTETIFTFKPASQHIYRGQCLHFLEAFCQKIHKLFFISYFSLK